MSSEQSETKSPFVDLASFESVKTQASTPGGNVIKRNQVSPGKTHRLELHESGENGAEVIVHREGEQINSIEFVCKCGCTTSLKLEYDGE